MLVELPDGPAAISDLVGKQDFLGTGQPDLDQRGLCFQRVAEDAVTRGEPRRFVDPYYVLHEVGTRPVDPYTQLKAEGGVPATPTSRATFQKENQTVSLSRSTTPKPGAPTPPPTPGPPAQTPPPSSAPPLTPMGGPWEEVEEEDRLLATTNRLLKERDQGLWVQKPIVRSTS